MSPTRSLVFRLVLLGLAAPGCAGGPPPEAAPPAAEPAAPAAPAAEPEAAAEAGPRAGPPSVRAIPEAPPPPPGYRRAVERGTRSATGAPGPRYWQQWTEYDLHARLHPRERALEGRARIVYRNRSPDTLAAVYLHLIQNVHAPGAARNEPHPVTGGVQLRRLAAGGVALRPEPPEEEPGYRVRGTVVQVVPPRPLPPDGSLELEVEWAFAVPQAGVGERMGWSGEDLFFVAYWYPQMAVYDDVVGWHLDPFLGAAEFYAGFANYRLAVEAPAGWVVRSTGTLENPEEVLAEPARERLRRAASSDSVVRVADAAEMAAGRVTREDAGGPLTWRFRADTVRDVAFSATRASHWDAVRAPVGDRDGDGAADHALMEALWRPSAPLWEDVARYGRHALDVHSRYTGVPYPWPHMTAVEGGGIIGGGMEFPMMTLMGDYNARGDSALYFVTAHELAHMWVPMIVSSDEKRYGWMDEGLTTFLENQARKEWFPGNPSDSLDAAAYLEVAREGAEGEVMRWSDYHYTTTARIIASYMKPATLLVALRGLLGEEVFRSAYATFHREWAYRHPLPWDLFRTFERIARRDLGWFWRAWLFETWTMDHAVAEVRDRADGSVVVVIEDRGEAPMPVRLRATRADGERVWLEVPVEAWAEAGRRLEAIVPPGAPVVRVELDPEGHFPDVEPGNDRWERGGGG